MGLRGPDEEYETPVAVPSLLDEINIGASVLCLWCGMWSSQYNTDALPRLLAHFLHEELFSSLTSATHPEKKQVADIYTVGRCKLQYRTIAVSFISPLRNCLFPLPSPRAPTLGPQPRA